MALLVRRIAWMVAQQRDRLATFDPLYELTDPLLGRLGLELGEEPFRVGLQPRPSCR